MGTEANGNGNTGDWAQTFAAFHEQHRDAKGRKLKFTAVFNITMEAFIGNPDVPIEWRLLAFIWRHSWGNSSNAVVDGIEGLPLRQRDIVIRLGVSRQRVSDAMTYLRAANYVASDTGTLIQPTEDPSHTAQATGEEKVNQYPGLTGQFFAFCSLWAVRRSAYNEELESADATSRRLRLVRLRDYKKWKRDPTNWDASLYTTENSKTNSVTAAAAIVSEPAAEPEQNTAAAASPAGESACPGASYPRLPEIPGTEVAVIANASQEGEEVRAVLAQYGTTDPPTARRMINECRKVAPTATALEICHFIRRKGDELVRRPSVKNPIGLLLKVVPHDFEGDFRQRLQEPPPRQSLSPAQQKLQDQREEIEQGAAMLKIWRSMSS